MVSKGPQELNEPSDIAEVPPQIEGEWERFSACSVIIICMVSKGYQKLKEPSDIAEVQPPQIEGEWECA